MTVTYYWAANHVPEEYHIHFVGIGGIGMSGIAELLLNLGYRFPDRI